MRVAARNLVTSLLGVLIALWMGIGRWAFGIGGELTWWYAPLIAIPYAILQLWTVRRLQVAEDRGRPIGRKTYVALGLSWACALAFGLTVPDLSGGELVSVLSHLAGAQWIEMSIALCNPFGIVAFATAVAALAFAHSAGREPRLSEDELLDAAERAGVEPGMVEHPLG